MGNVPVDLRDSASREVDVDYSADKVSFGNLPGSFNDLKDITGNKLDFDEVPELFKKALAGEVEGVSVTNIGCGENGDLTFSLVFTKTNSEGEVVTTDIANISGVPMDDFDASIDSKANIGDGRSSFNIYDLSDGKIGKFAFGTSKNMGDGEGGTTNIGDLVGGSAKGEKDLKALFEAALNPEDTRVELVGLDGDSFTIKVQYHDGSPADTMMFKGAGDFIADVLGPDSLINPKNPADQFVFVDLETSPNKIGIGTDNVSVGDEPDPTGGSVVLGDLPGIVAEADQLENIEVTEVFGLTKIEITDNSTDTIYIPTDDLAFL
ncbi:hypothetical protein [Ruegeria sp. R14_0]|uniref:hypothetical protein n=1 Tax=Ruegeria sp. R14_0 TaxID=2821100 RepID=UPI001ADB9B05|nr:hypothetical protein [Ruegeria sp. R14_0]MBO9445783.1 hypothetical protein [Ruegeria sp. R14_0]